MIAIQTPMNTAGRKMLNRTNVRTEYSVGDTAEE